MEKSKVERGVLSSVEAQFPHGSLSYSYNRDSIPFRADGNSADSVHTGWSQIGQLRPAFVASGDPPKKL